MNLENGAVELHKYLVQNHWNGESLMGPDPGIRLNLRLGRFIKSYLDFIPWHDNKVYIQAQGYWILDNWLISDLNLIEPTSCKEIAYSCSKFLINMQDKEGYWVYPEKGWKKRISTGEGNYGAIALTESYRRTGNKIFLDKAISWYDYVVNKIGFKEDNDSLSVNYFGKYNDSGMVPNITASTLRMFANLTYATKNDKYLKYCSNLVKWLSKVQLDSGELPYEICYDNVSKSKTHYLCFNYNSFQFLNLLEYYKMTMDPNIFTVLQKLALFLKGGLLESGAAKYNCHKEKPYVLYYTAALIAAFREASILGFGNFENLIEKGNQYILSKQKKDGDLFFYSKNNYWVLTDHRPYPRYLSMILYNLLTALNNNK
jgi:hypothetical protein